jgi:hypothetical protein
MATSNNNFMDIDLTRRNKKPRPLSDAERNKLEEYIDSIHYSGRYVLYPVLDRDFSAGSWSSVLHMFRRQEN